MGAVGARHEGSASATTSSPLSLLSPFARRSLPPRSPAPIPPASAPPRAATVRPRCGRVGPGRARGGARGAPRALARWPGRSRRCRRRRRPGPRSGDGGGRGRRAPRRAEGGRPLLAARAAAPRRGVAARRRPRPARPVPAGCHPGGPPSVASCREKEQRSPRSRGGATPQSAAPRAVALAAHAPVHLPPAPSPHTTPTSGSAPVSSFEGTAGMRTESSRASSAASTAGGGVAPRRLNMIGMAAATGAGAGRAERWERVVQASSALSAPPPQRRRHGGLPLPQVRQGDGRFDRQVRGRRGGAAVAVAARAHGGVGWGARMSGRRPRLGAAKVDLCLWARGRGRPPPPCPPARRPSFNRRPLPPQLRPPRRLVRARQEGADAQEGVRGVAGGARGGRACASARRLAPARARCSPRGAGCAATRLPGAATDQRARAVTGSAAAGSRTARWRPPRRSASREPHARPRARPEARSFPARSPPSALNLRRRVAWWWRRRD